MTPISQIIECYTYDCIYNDKRYHECKKDQIIIRGTECEDYVSIEDEIEED